MKQSKVDRALRSYLDLRIAVSNLLYLEREHARIKESLTAARTHLDEVYRAGVHLDDVEMEEVLEKCCGGWAEVRS